MPRKKQPNKFPLALPDWEDRILNKKSLLPDTGNLEHWDKKMADEALSLFSLFPITALQGVPTAGEVTPEWLKELVWWWFGCVDPKTRNRSCPEMMLSVSKKGGKSSSLGLMMLLQMVLSKRKNSQSIILAPTKQVADTSFRMIVGAVENTPYLSDEYKIANAERVIRSKADGWRKQLKVVAADLNALVGTTAEYILLDELHVLGKGKDTKHLLTHARGARTGQPSASLMICSTMSHDVVSPAWDEELALYRSIRDGETDLNWLPLLYEFPKKMLEDESYKKPKYWYVTNPSLGSIGTLEDMKKEYAAAHKKSPEDESNFFNQRLNVPPALNMSDRRWPGADYWMKCFDKSLADPTMDGLDNLLDRSEAVTIGIDGGGLFDCLGLAVLGREKETRRWLLWSHAWAHNGLLETRPILGEKLRFYSDKGELTLVDYGAPQEGISHPLQLVELGEVVSYVNASGKLPQRKGVGIDDLSIIGIVEAIMSEDLETPLAYEQLASVKQGYRLSPIIQGLANKVCSDEFRHGGFGIMEWAVNSAIMRPRGNAVSVEKSDTSSDTKIDPLVALFNAAWMMQVIPQATGGVGVYELA